MQNTLEKNKSGISLLENSFSTKTKHIRKHCTSFI